MVLQKKPAAQQAAGLTALTASFPTMRAAAMCSRAGRTSNGCIPRLIIPLLTCRCAVSELGKSTYFDRYHPAVAVVYFGAVLLFAMCVMQPIYLLLSFAGAVLFGGIVRGWPRTFSSLVWQVPLVLLIALVNPLFSASGSTVLFRVGAHAFYFESLFYGACQGLMIVNVLVILQNAAAVLSMDKLLSVGGHVMPNVTLMTSMVARLVPQFLRRGREISAVSAACTAAQGCVAPAADGAPRGNAASVAGAVAQGSAVPVADVVVQGRVRASRVSKSRAMKSASLRKNFRLSTVLMGWGLEDSVENAQAMQARGWGACPRRSSYALNRFRGDDALALVVLAALAASSAVSAYVACQQWEFYPALVGLAPWFSYAPFAVLVCLPAVLELWERAQWRK